MSNIVLFLLTLNDIEGSAQPLLKALQTSALLLRFPLSFISNDVVCVY